MIGEKINTLTVDEVRERFPNGISIERIHEGFALFYDENKVLRLADFRKFLGSITYPNLCYLNNRAHPFNRFDLQRSKYRERRINQLIKRFVYSDKQ